MRDLSPAGRTRIDVVVVLFHSDRVLLERCVASVQASAARSAVDARLVFVDNGGGLPASGQWPADAVVVGGGCNLGFGRAVNAALEHVTAPYALLLNPDAALADDAFDAFLRADRSWPGALLAGTMLTDGRLDPDSVIDWDFSVERLVKRRRPAGRRGPGGVVAVEKVSGGALFGRSDLLRSLGPFDDRFFLYAEDADLSRRAARSGIALGRVEDALVLHEGSASSRSFPAIVEFARADAAIRLTALHRSRIVSLAQRAELLVVTLLGMVVERDVRRRRARAARLHALRRWGLRRDCPGVVAPDPGDLG